MSAKIVLSPEEFPAPICKRKSTDSICTLLAGILAAALFLTACLLFDTSAINQAYFWQLTSTSG